MTAITIADLNNAKTDVDHIAAIATSVELTATDRLGHVKSTLAAAIDSIKSWTDRGAWTALTAYAGKDLVSNGGTWYVCVVAHTSSAAFATDTASKWRVYQGITVPELAAPSGASLVGYLPAGTGAVATDVQSKLRESVSVFDFMTPAEIADALSGAPVLNMSAALQAAINTGKSLYWPAAHYLGNVTIPNVKQFHWYGDGSKASILTPFSSATPAVTNLFQDPDWCYSSVSDMGIVGAGAYPGPYAGIGFCMGSHLGYPAGYTEGMELVGRVIFNRVQFRGFSKCVYKPYGNIGNVFNDCTWQWADYGYYAKGINTLTHPGADIFNGGQINACEIAGVLVIDDTPGTGGITFNQTIIEFNRGFGIFMDFGIGNAFSPIYLNNIWDESNGTDYTPSPLATVTIDTLTGPQVLAPTGVKIRGLYSHIQIGKNGGSTGFATLNPQATIGVWGNQQTAIRAIAGGFGASWTRFSFSEQGYENIDGAYITSSLGGGAHAQGRGMVFSTDAGNQAPLGLGANGSVTIGTDAAAYAAPAAGTHAIWAPSAIGAGATAVSINARFFNPTEFCLADGAPGNAALAVLRLAKVESSGRSINAGGTINAAGADYAEYERNNGLVFAKGDIIGFKADGTLTNVFAAAIRFAIKSTNPSYVGGDTWGSEGQVGKRPEQPTRKADKTETTGEGEDAVTTVTEPGDTDAEWEAKQAAYETAKAAFEATLEAARQLVDRIAYSGKVPCNVLGATPGGYIIAVDNAGAIVGEFVANPDFAQYKKAVGRVNRILPDGRCEVAVIIH